MEYRMNQEARLDYLIQYLKSEKPSVGEQWINKVPVSINEKMALFRGLCNIRDPYSISSDFLKVQDAFLTEWNKNRAVISRNNLTAVQPQLYLWQGDITTLAVDAIVNAANSELIGCRRPNHDCIDNWIHTLAGVQLRQECHALIQAQNRKEPIGKAKITKAYNLPAKNVIHTVGPFIDKRGVSKIKEHLLASCYLACLRLADEHRLDTIVFCCISTGEFNFPNQRAAEIAIQTVKTYIKDTESKLHVIFNVFKEKDLNIYQSLLTEE